MFRTAKHVGLLLIVSGFVTPCLLPGQGLTSASATLQPSGEVRYQATYLFHLERDPQTVVPHAPYSAEEVEESANVASSGSSERLVRKVYRDSKGRVRIEGPLSLGVDDVRGPTVVQIFDVVSGWVYVLDSQAKVAHRYRPGAVSTPQVHGRRFVEASTAVPGQPARHSMVEVPEAEPGSDEPKVATLPVNVTHASEDLGEKRVDGLLVRGVRYITPSVSDDGTRRTLTAEVWTSPELQVVVMSKFFNQQASDHVDRLVHLTRTEPEAALFEVPAEYQIHEETTDFRIGVNFEAARSR
jgi:hypothetical protein